MLLPHFANGKTICSSLSLFILWHLKYSDLKWIGVLFHTSIEIASSASCCGRSCLYRFVVFWSLANYLTIGFDNCCILSHFILWHLKYSDLKWIGILFHTSIEIASSTSCCGRSCLYLFSYCFCLRFHSSFVISFHLCFSFYPKFQSMQIFVKNNHCLSLFGKTQRDKGNRKKMLMKVCEGRTKVKKHE